MPRLQLKDVFHIWFQYATKSCHHLLSQSTVCTLAEKMDDIMTFVYSFIFMTMNNLFISMCIP